MKKINLISAAIVYFISQSSLAYQANSAFWQKQSASWYQEAYIKAVNAGAGDLFGKSVAISGDTLAVGASGEDSSQTSIINGTTASADDSLSAVGAVYIYKRTGSTWAQQAYIKASNAETTDNFGDVIDLDGDTLAVAAKNEDSAQTTITNGTTASADNTKSASGAVYVFKRTGTNWAQEAYIKAVNADVDDNFGAYISLDMNTLAVGVSGEDSNQTTITNGTTASADNSSVDSGAVYIYKRSGSAWAQEAYIKAVNADAGDLFGNVTLSGDTLAVGAVSEDSAQVTITNGTTASADNTKSTSGAVYVYKRSGSTWAQEAYIKASNADASDAFGNKVAVSGDTLAVAAWNEDSNQTTITIGSTASADNTKSGSGAVYIFTRTGTSWSQAAYIKASNADSSDGFGTALALFNDTLAVGTWNEASAQTTITNGPTASADNSSLYTGAVYIFNRKGSNWKQQAYIKAANANSVDYFGSTISLNANYLAVSAINEDSNQITITNGDTASSDNSLSNSGAVYVYRY